MKDIYAHFFIIYLLASNGGGLKMMICGKKRSSFVYFEKIWRMVNSFHYIFILKSALQDKMHSFYELNSVLKAQLKAYFFPKEVCVEMRL